MTGFSHQMWLKHMDLFTLGLIVSSPGDCTLAEICFAGYTENVYEHSNNTAATFLLVSLGTLCEKHCRNIPDVSLALKEPAEHLRNIPVALSQIRLKSDHLRCMFTVGKYP